MSEYQWWADPDLAPLGSMIGVAVVLGLYCLFMKIGGRL